LILGLGLWGLGMGVWGLRPTPNPQSPISNPQSPIPNPLLFYINKKMLIIKFYKKNFYFKLKYFIFNIQLIKKCFKV